MSSSINHKNKKKEKSNSNNKEEEIKFDNNENNIKLIKRTIENNTHEVIED